MTAAPNDWLGLSGKKCVISGAAGGIGTALATSFAATGASVALLDLQAPDATAAEVARQSGQLPLALACDVTNPDQVSAMAARIGPCDILVNNAGILRPAALADMSLAEWNMLLGVNLGGYFLCAQAFGAAMRAQGHGAIVHVASIAGSLPQPNSGAYSVSKAGIRMLSRQIAAEWGPFGVRSNVVSPGLVETPLSAKFYAVPGVRERRSAMVPNRRIGTAQDMADAAVFLASARADYINGEEIIVDGGFGTTLMGLVPRPGYD